MKRSKIVLGMTTGILAVAALVAAKASKFARDPLAYYSLGHNSCTYLASGATYYTKNFNGNVPAVDNNGNFLFSYSKTACQHRLYTQSGD